MKVGDLLQIQYVAPRGVSTEQGAVQRILNKKRISQIKDFILAGNSFVNTFILNWTDTENLPKIKKETLNIPLQGRRAQILDGQHRVAGLQEAVNVKPEISETEVLVSLCIGLKTQDAAKIFLIPYLISFVICLFNNRIKVYDYFLLSFYFRQL